MQPKKLYRRSKTVSKKKLSKAEYLKKKELKSNIKSEKALEKTGEFVSKHEFSIQRELTLHELFKFAQHSNTMFSNSPIRRGNR